MMGAALSILLGSTAPDRVLTQAPSEWTVSYVLTRNAGRDRFEFDVTSDGRFVEHDGAFDRRRHGYVPACAPRSGVLWHWFALGWAVDQSFREDWNPVYRNARSRDGATVMVRIENTALHRTKTVSLSSPYAAGAEHRPDGLNYIVTMSRKSLGLCGRGRA
ncbi:MAG: hypothetical protein ABR591_08540 [Candidatus Velthaea sp.]